jgi:hypothetical protein
MQIDRTITNSKQHVVIGDNGKAACVLIDVAISSDRQVIKKEAQ